MNLVPKLRFVCRRFVSTNKGFSTDASQDPTLQATKSGGYAKSFEKFTHINDEPKIPKTFTSLLRNSKFVDVSRSDFLNI